MREPNIASFVRTIKHCHSTRRQPVFHMQDKTPRPSAKRRIDETLRRVYAEVEGEEVPERFLELIRKLKEQDRQGPNE